MQAIQKNNMWTRSSEGWIAGVCQALGERFDINPNVVRIFWLASVMIFGLGLVFYFICAFCLPVEGKEEQALQPKFLGVCYRLSQRMDLDVGLLRIATVLIALGSFGTTLLVYIVAHFLLSERSSTR